jgi:hypothetical protein
MSLVPLVLRFLLVLVFAASAAAQVSISIVPSAGFGVEGVGINATGLPTNDIVSVTFDGIPSLDPLFYLAGTMYAGAPPHEPGEVEVRATFRDGQVAATRFRYTTYEEWERVLMPVNIRESVPGAFGSLWTTDSYFGAIDRPLDLRTDFCDEGARYGIACPPVYALRLLPGVPSKLQPVSGSVGAFVYVLRDAKRSLAAQSWVRDLSRSSEAFGTEQPLVPLSEFRTHLMLIGLPAPPQFNEPQFRVLLRIYGSSARATRARVRITSMSRTMTPFDQVIDLQAHPSANNADQRHWGPSFAQLSFDSLPELKALGPVRVEVISVDGDPLWAFASITNNITQHVTLATPQP